jgi:hypothetical protein
VSSEHLPGSPADRGRREPYRVRLSGFITDGDVGLGDVIKKATSIVGIQPCDGCAERAARLNDWMFFTAVARR